jgi:hypothetical protein
MVEFYVPGCGGDSITKPHQIRAEIITEPFSRKGKATHGLRERANVEPLLA